MHVLCCIFSSAAITYVPPRTPLCEHTVVPKPGPAGGNGADYPSPRTHPVIGTTSWSADVVGIMNRSYLVALVHSAMIKMDYYSLPNLAINWPILKNLVGYLYVHYRFVIKAEDDWPGGDVRRSYVPCREERHHLQCVSKKTSPTFLAVTRESIVGFS